MSKSKKNISVKKPSDKREELKDFLKDNLSDELLYAFENSRDDAFVKDALEGLAAFSTTENIKKHTQSLNKKLVNSAAGKKEEQSAATFADVVHYHYGCYGNITLNACLCGH